ncbi:uncharacterized protein LOC101888572 [Musca domestica]|uniref:Uncharacterized protein LOC101888572 n=1 Tax=Musca domestica TaxID=7370 RepID=A0A1I8MLF9_MUSDO|nr:uncharacterized protein LOC101888572 [Musca domestica]
MMAKQSSQVCVLLALGLLVAVQAAVIRSGSEEMKDKIEVTTVESVTTEQVDPTTQISLTDDIKVDEEEETTTMPEYLGALSRDEEATILIVDQTLMDSAPSESKQSPEPSVQEEKFGKLLLLSTPKLVEKPKLPEENFEESEELDTSENSTDATTVEPTTTDSSLAEEVTTLAPETKEEEDEGEKSEVPQVTTPIPTTKLFPINDTLYEEKKKDSSKPEETSEASPVVVAMDEEPKEVKNSNLEAIVLSESEADYVLVDTADAEIIEEGGVYADVDSDLHLQPIVQSVEIVPSSVDDSLLVNYVHSL